MVNKVVLVTRPAHQAADFIKELERSGATALAFPSMEIEPVEVTEQLLQLLSGLNKYHLLIFISSNAVKYAATILQKLDLPIETINCEIATIGKATHAAADSVGFKVSLQPENGFNSDALLQLPALQTGAINSKRVLIMRGEGGLEQLADTLTQRGAEVSYAEVYRRIKPRRDTGISRQQLSHQWEEMAINTVTVTSNESLQNLYDMLEAPGRTIMLATHLIVPSQRCYDLAMSLGFESVKIAESAINQHMIEAIFN